MIINNKQFLQNIQTTINKIEKGDVCFSLTLMLSIFIYIAKHKHLTENIVAYLAQYYVSTENTDDEIYKFLEANFEIEIIELICSKEHRVVSVERKEVCDA